VNDRAGVLTFLCGASLAEQSNMNALTLILVPAVGPMQDLPYAVDGYFSFRNIDLDPDLGGKYEYHAQGPTTSVDASGAMVTADLNNNEALKTICSTNAYACHYFNTCDARMGYWTMNDSNTTYLKNTTGAVETDDAGGKYLHVKNADTYCISYTGWALPASMVKTQCDQDSSCSGFKMRNDNSFGWLCKVSPGVVCNDGWFRLSPLNTVKALAQ
jgi:hypothetical protein